MTDGLSDIFAEAALLAAVVFGPLAFGAVEAQSFAVLEGFLLAACLFSTGFGASSALKRTLLPGVLLVAGIGLLQRLNPAPINGPRGLAPFSASAPETTSALASWLLAAVMLWRLPPVLARSGALRRLAWALLTVGFTVAVIGFIQNANGNHFVYGWRPILPGRSAFGPYFNRAHAACLLAMSGVVGAGLLAEQAASFRRCRDAELSDHRARQFLTGFLVATVFSALLVLRNRGSLLGLAVSAAIVLGSRGRRFAALAAAVMIAVGLAAVPRLRGVLKDATGSVPQRVMMYRGGIKIAADFPVFGTGLGTTLSVFGGYKEKAFIYDVDHVHNDWLELAMETGLVGLVTWTAALITFLYRSASSLDDKRMALAFLAAGAGFLAHGLVDFNSHIPANAAIFLLLLCGLEACLVGQPTALMPRTWRAVLVVGSLGLMVIAGRDAISERFFMAEDYANAYRWRKAPHELYGAAWSLFRAGSLNQALELCEKGRRQTPYRQNFAVLEASILNRLGRVEGARP